MLLHELAENLSHVTGDGTVHHLILIRYDKPCAENTYLTIYRLYLSVISIVLYTVEAFYNCQQNEAKEKYGSIYCTFAISTEGLSDNMSCLYNCTEN